MDDKELIRRIQNGQKDLLNEIAQKYYDDIYYFCAYQSGSRETAHDLTQETFLRFIRYVDHYKYKNLKGYLLTIAMNVCRSHFTKETNTPLPIIPESDNTQQPPAPPLLARKEQSYLLKEALLQIPENQREAVILHHLYGYKNREIAKMTGASYGAVKSRINQGLAKLKKLLREEDFYE